MFKKPFIALMFFVFCSSFQSIAFAQAEYTGIDAKASLAVPIVLYNNDLVFLDAQTGIGFGLALGYRWSYAGVYVDQSFNSVFVENDENKPEAQFMGTFYVMGRGFYPIMSKLQMHAGLCLGFIYGSHETRENLGLSKNDVAFSLKTELGFTYFVNDMIGVGFDFNYAYAVAKVPRTFIGMTISIKHKMHIITPGIHVNLRF